MLHYLKCLIVILIKYICVILAITVSTHSSSFEPTRFMNITAEDGLASSYVSSIAQDSKGFIWVGTQSGLSRYDGYQYVNYRHLLDNSSSLSDDDISAVVTDLKSNVWIGTVSGGINKLNTTTGNITHYTHQKNNPNSIRSNLIQYLYLEGDSKLWIATSKGLDVLDTVTEKVDHINLTSEINESLFVSDVLHIDNNLWFATSMAIYIYNTVSQSITPINLSSTSAIDSSINYIYDFFRDANNQVWVATSEGLAQVQTNDFKVIYTGLLTGLINNTYITSITGDSTNNLWIATMNNGIFKINPKRTTYKHYYKNIYLSDTLNLDSITKLFIDNTDVLWAVSKMGLGKLSLRTESFGIQRHLPTQNNLKNKPIRGLHEDINGNLWVRQDKLLRFNREIDNYDEPFKSISNYNKEIFLKFDMNTSDNNNLWLASGGDKIVYYDITNDAIEYYSIKEFQNDGLLPNGNFHIRGLFNDKNLNLLWINTNKGLYQFYRGSHKLKLITYLPNNMQYKLHGYINEIFTDSKGYTWLGTYFGLFQLKGEKLINHFQSDANNGNSISQNAVFSLASEEDHLWIGTQNGLNKYSYNTKTFSLLTMQDGLADNHIRSTLLDKNNNLWVNTNRGLSRINTSNGNITNFHKNDGLQSDVFRISSMLARKNGQLVFGGDKGFNIFNPDEIEKAKVKDVQISELHLFNNKVYLADLQTKNHEQNITDPNTIVLDHKQNDLSITLSAVDYHDPMSILYRYKLEGFNDTWINRDAKNRTASFTNLNHGTYTLKAQATYDPNNYWSPEKNLLTIIVLPPWWQTIYAYVSYILIAIALIYGLIRLQTYRLKRKAIELETIVNQRTQQIQNQKSLIEEQAEHLQVLIKKKDQVFSHISHEFRTPLTLILGPLKHLFNMVNETQQKSIELVQTNAYRLLRLVDQLLELSKLHAEQDAPTTKEKNVSVETKTLIEAILPSFVVLAENKKINLELTHHDHCQVACSYDSLEKIVTNLLSNAIKYTLEDGDISLYITNKNNTHCEIIVKDNGLGIPEDQKDSIFEPFARVENDAKREAIPGTGIGLSLVKELVETHEGTIHVESQLGIGSYFTVDLPLADAKSQITFQKNQHIDEVNLDIIDLTNRLQKELTPETESLPNGKDIKLDEERPVLLIIEDNPEMRQYIKGLCSPHYQCILAANGKQGSQLAIEYIPDIILSDIMMPELDGHGCLRIIKADRRTCHIPVILLSALKDRENRIQGLQERADDVLTKPFDSEELLVRLENLLAIRDLVKQPRDIDQKEDDKDKEKPAQPKISELDQLFLDHFDQMLDKYYVDEGLGLETMAQHLLLSNRQMQRKLKALTGKNPNEYLRDFRLQKAIERLEKGYRVEDVAYDVGFSSRSYFSKCFKSKYKSTPKHYQQQFVAQAGLK